MAEVQVCLPGDSVAPAGGKQARSLFLDVQEEIGVMCLYASQDLSDADCTSHCGEIAETGDGDAHAQDWTSRDE
ncbi:hypothetical protein ACFVIY_28375 [Streptomyces sp. NPDC127166]|uniref:hypothetical protein n=1 Tax=Streptomyces sp. NPDC127166 TaxID=3345380 RepID=UPI0036351836